MAQTTVVPFSTLPACATACYHLYDANGACVPPVLPTFDSNCFCNYGALQPWRTSVADLCNGQCASADLTSVVGWFDNFCSITLANNGQGQPQTQTQTSSGPGATPGSSSGGSSSDDTGGGDWLSNHWKWVIMLVILVVAIAGGWIGACIWRRRYLRRKDRAFELAKHAGSGSAAAHASWGPGHGNSASNIPWAGGAANGPPRTAPSTTNLRGKSNADGAGMFMPGTRPAVYDEKPKPVKEKKKWVVKERT